MKLSIRALTLVGALLWGGAMLFVSVANLFLPTYGVIFLQMVASVYPGFHAAGTAGDALIGTMYAVVDGAICGCLIGWLYNGFAGGWRRPG